MARPHILECLPHDRPAPDEEEDAGDADEADVMLFLNMEPHGDIDCNKRKKPS